MIFLILSALVSGLFVGLISSVLGLGGGIIIVPLLTLVFRLPQNEAVATSLATIALITLFNTIRFQKLKLINWKLVLIIITFSAISSFGGGYLATIMNQRVLLFIFILFVFYVLVQTFISASSTQSVARNHSAWFWGSVIGTSSGLISGTTGVGGGAIITPLLFKSRIESPDRVVPVTNAVMFINAVFAIIPFALSSGIGTSLINWGMIHLDRALLIFAGAIPASIWGTKFQSRIPQKVKKILIIFILGVILFRMAWRFLAGA